MIRRTPHLYLHRYLLLPFYIPKFSFNNIKSTLDQEAIHLPEKASVLCGADKLLLLDYFVRSNVPYAINKSFNDLGIKVDWHFKATSQDLVNTLYDTSYQSIATLGHGNNDICALADCDITTEDIQEIYQDRPKKKGFWLQFSCGGEGEQPLGYHVMENPRRNCRFFSQTVTVFDMTYCGLPDECLETWEVRANAT